ncbi:MAG: radical SAM protein [Myxococcota bacterium]|nr:radical SAM protein [Myxococcota bacterium]
MKVRLLCPPPSLDSELVRPRHAPHYTAIVAASLQRAGHAVSFTDLHLKSCSVEDLLQDLRWADPELLLVTHSDYNRELRPEVLEQIFSALAPELGPDRLWGFARLDAAHAVAAMEASPSMPGLLFGEPELAAVALVEALSEGRSVTGLPGTVQRQGEELEINPAEKADLDESPVPAWDLVDVRHYGFSPHQQAADAVYPVLASRGCPFPCFYCEVRARPSWTARSVDSVIGELQTLHERHGARSFFLADPTFAVERDWALEFCRRVKDEGPPGFRWSCMSRTDRVDPELLQAMASAGCWNILFGIESLNPEALEAASKNLDPATVGPAIRAAREAGLEVIASIMIGLPGDTPAGVESTLDKLIEMEPDFAQFFVVQIAENELPDGGRLVSDWDGSRYDFWGHVFAPDAFEGREQLLAIRRAAYRRFYLRPRYLRTRLGRMVRSGEFRPQLRRAVQGGVLALRLAVGQRPSV